MHVLVVEDTPVAQKFIVMQMTNQGCTVDIADDGQAAIQKANTIQYDLILMDIGLGDGPDGFEVTQKIKASSQLNCNTPVMAVTAHEGSEYYIKGVSCGMERYYNKPLTVKLAAEIVQYIKNKNASN